MRAAIVGLAGACVALGVVPGLLVASLARLAPWPVSMRTTLSLQLPGSGSLPTVGIAVVLVVLGSGIFLLRGKRVAAPAPTWACGQLIQPQLLWTGAGFTKPLRLGDTGFDVSPDKKDRGAHPQKEGPKNEAPPIPDVTLKTTWKSGGGGMVSTAADYARFLQMFANGGQLDGARIISRKTIDLMTADHLPPDIKMGDDMWRFEALEPSARMGQGFGLGFAVRNEQGRNPLPGSPNDYYWGGAWGTYFWHDPREHMYVVFMMQSRTARLPYRYLMRDLVYQALIGN